MSRQWKPINRGLPGWYSYTPPLKRDLPNKKRKFFKRRSKLKAINKKFQGPSLKRVAFKNHRSGTVRKLLRINGPSGAADCLWERRQGTWHCVAAPNPFDWFTRVRHPDLIRDWLVKNHYDFHWLSLQIPAPNRSAGQSYEASRTGTPETPLSVSPERPQDDQSLHGSGLERNGVTTSSPLNSPGCPGNSQDQSLLH